MAAKDSTGRFFRVAECFLSINGEARRAGELSAFIRFTGCNLKCNYCDTSWACDANAPYELMTAEDIHNYIKELNVKNVTLTGGEPLLQPEFSALLLELLSDKRLRVEIETNGAVDITPLINEVTTNLGKAAAERMSFTLDYKCPGSGMESFMNPKNFTAARHVDTVKFVVSDERDLDKMSEVCAKYGLTDKLQVYVSAVFDRISPETIVGYMITHNLNDIRLQLQLHKYIWDPDKRGV